MPNLTQLLRSSSWNQSIYNEAIFAFSGFTNIHCRFSVSHVHFLLCRTFFVSFPKCNYSDFENTNPLDVPPLCSGARHAQANHVHEQARDPQQVHGVTNERRRDDVVDEEGAVVGKEHAPFPRGRGKENHDKFRHVSSSSSRLNT